MERKIWIEKKMVNCEKRDGKYGKKENDKGRKEKKKRMKRDEKIDGKFGKKM